MRINVALPRLVGSRVVRHIAYHLHLLLARVYQNYHSNVAVETRLIASLQSGGINC